MSIAGHAGLVTAYLVVGLGCAERFGIRPFWAVVVFWPVGILGAVLGWAARGLNVLARWGGLHA